MPTYHDITDADDPRVDAYRNQKDAWLRAAHNPAAGPDATPTGHPHGRFMAESELVLDHLLESEYVVESLLLAPGRAARLAGRLGSLPGETPVFVAERPVMERICGHDVHRGVLALARRGPDRDPIELARSVRTLVVLEEMSNHDNVGGIMRSTAALAGIGEGDAGVLLSPRSCDPLYRKSVRVSMGLALRVPFATLAPWPDGVRALRELGFTVLAMTPAIGSRDLSDVARELPPSARVAVLIGAEGPGLTDAAIEAADCAVRIPIASGVDSLNAGVACAIALASLGRVGA